jgi:hypothetical protein
MNPKQLKARYPYMFAGPNAGFEFHRGWFPVFTRLCNDIDALLDKDKQGFHWTQLKEKFGSARFYWAMKGHSPDLHIDFISAKGVASLVRRGAARSSSQSDATLALPERIGALVRKAAQDTTNLCIVCGQPGSENHDDSWSLTLCKLHAQQRREGKLEPAWFDDEEV